MSVFRISTLFILLTVLLITGCASSPENPSSPPLDNTNEMVLTGESVESSHVPWGFWTISIDRKNFTVNVNPDRNARMHFDITSTVLPPNCHDCLELSVNSYNPDTQIVNVDVTLRNPTILAGRDVRGIFYTDDEYRLLLNPDDWTGLWDIPGGEEINPFKAFAKGVSSRIFAAGESYTENYRIHMTHWENVRFAVDASWPENCEEPYEIDDFEHGYLSQDAGVSCVVDVVVHDWLDDTNEVRLWAPEITGTEFLPLIYVTDDRWTGILANNEGVSEGIYTALISAGSELDDSLELYDKVEINVSGPHPELNVEMVTPEWLNFTPDKTIIEGNYLFTSSYSNGTHIWNISDPVNPVWVDKVSDNEYIINLRTIENGLAYFGENRPVYPSNYLRVYDVESPEEMILLDTLGPFDSYYDIGGGYLCSVLNGEMEIWDIDPYEDAYVANTLEVELGSNVVIRRVNVFEGMAYVHLAEMYEEWDWIRIYSIDPPEDAHYVDTWSYHGSPRDMDVEDGVAVVTGYSIYGGYSYTYWIKIYDARTGESLGGFNTEYPPGALVICDGYAYVNRASPDHEIGKVAVVDITVPEDAEIVDILPCPEIKDVARSGNILYTAVTDEGLRVYDYTPPGEATMLNALPSPSVYPLAAGENVVVCGSSRAFATCDVSDVSAAQFKNLILPDGDSGLDEACMDGDMAYITQMTGPDTGVLKIIDVSVPENPVTVNKVDTFSDGNDIDIENGFVCLVGNDYGLELFDVDPPESAHMTDSIESSENPAFVRIHGGNIYVLDYEQYAPSLFHILDISDPYDIQHVKSIGLQPGDPEYRSRCLDVAGDFAYISMFGPLGDDERILRLVDISDPESAYVYTTHEFERSVSNMKISNGYLFAGWSDAVLGQGIKIFDVTSPDELIDVGFFATVSGSNDMDIAGEYFYTTGYSGLEIYRLW